jgi:hypothetical protein
MIQIICIRWGTKFPDEYINRLFRGVSRNTSKEFLFTCFTNSQSNLDKNISVRPIPLFTGDWYSKISLYNEELYNPEDQVFFLDLDTVIIGDMDELLSYTGDFIIFRDFYRPDGFQSAFMSWRPHAVNHMWKNYTRGYKSRFGDQGWPEEQYPTADIWQEKYYGQIASYKKHIRDWRMGGIRGEKMSMDNVRVLCFHGRPALHEVHQYWNMYAT